jgi:hypothetical protein
VDFRLIGFSFSISPKEFPWDFFPVGTGDGGNFIQTCGSTGHCTVLLVMALDLIFFGRDLLWARLGVLLPGAWCLAASAITCCLSNSSMLDFTFGRNPE